jgi:hypothetical protein
MGVSTMTVFAAETAYQYIETGREPEYFVTHVRTEPADGDNIRVMAYAKRHTNELHLLYTAIVPPACLAIIGRQCLHAASAGHNLIILAEAPPTH